MSDARRIAKAKKARKKVLVRVRFYPRAGRPVKLVRHISEEGTVDIGSSTYNIPEESLFPGEKPKDKLPECVIKEGYVTAFCPQEVTGLTARGLNGIVNATVVSDIERTIPRTKGLDKLQGRDWIVIGLLVVNIITVVAMLSGLDGTLEDLEDTMKLLFQSRTQSSDTP